MTSLLKPNRNTGKDKSESEETPRETPSIDDAVDSASEKAESPAEEPPIEERHQDDKDVTLDDVEARLAVLEGLFRAKIDRTEYEVETLRKQSDEMQGYRNDLFAKVMHPLLREVARIHSGIKQVLAHADDSELIGAVAVEAYVDDLADLLSDYGIEEYAPEPGSSFVSGLCKIASKQETSDEALIGTIAELKSPGYMLESSKPFIPARVKVHVRAEGDSKEGADLAAAKESVECSSSDN